MGVKRWILTIFVLALVAGSLALLLLQSGADTVLLEKVLPRVEQRLGVAIEIEDIDVSLTSVVLDRVTIRPANGASLLPLAVIDRVGVGVRVGPLLLGNIDLTGVRIEGARLLLGADAGGASVDDWRAVADRFSTTGETLLEGGAAHGGEVEVVLVSGAIAAAHRGFEFSAGELAGRFSKAGGGKLSLGGMELGHRGRRCLSRAAGTVLAGPRTSRPGEARLAVTIERPEIELVASGDALSSLIEDARAVFADLFGPDPAGTDADGGPAAASLPLRLEFDEATVDFFDTDDPLTRLRLEKVRGEAVAGGAQPLTLRAEGRLPGTTADFSLAARRVGGKDPVTLELEVPDLPLADVGRLLHPGDHVLWERASTDGTLTIEFMDGGRQIAARGEVTVSGLGLRHERIAAAALEGLEAHADFKITWDRRENVIHMERVQISRGRARFTLRGHVRTDRLAFDTSLILPPTPCRQVLGAIPVQLADGLGDVVLEGNFGLDLRAALDVDAPGETALEVRLDNRCRIADFGDLPSPDQYRRPFTYQAYDENQERYRVLTGPGTDRWTPLARISPYLIEAVFTTEDGKFRGHAGVTVPELRRAIELNLQNRNLTHGASTITMQLAKNIFLTRERTVERKLQELFYTWYLESFFKKDEILEMYLNVVEFGPSIYGIHDAAYHYFGREPHELNLVESVFLIKLLPSPVRRYATYRHGQVSDRKLTSLHRTMRTMRSRGRITETEYQQGLAQPLEFHREGDPLPAPRIPPERGGFRLAGGEDDMGGDDHDETDVTIWESDSP